MKPPARRVVSSFALAMLLGACSGSSSGSSPSLTLTATDAASDELASFVVEIVAVELTLAAGGTLGLLPESVPVDFVELEDSSRVLDLVSSIPAGPYTQATVTLDFSSASVHLVGKTDAAAVLDGDGLPLAGTLTLPIQLLGALDAVSGRNHVLELDLDLDHSVAVDFAANEVQVEPAVVVRVDPANPKELALGGAFRRVDRNGFWIAIDTNPADPDHLVPVTVDGNTVYQIDGEPLVGPAGLTALESLAAGEWVQVFGAATRDSGSIRASSIEVGRGTYNGGSDIVEGHIVGRSGPPGTNATFTVLGHSDNSIHTEFQYDRAFTVTTDLVSTKVVRRGSASTHATDDLNVGQRVRFFGLLNGLDLAANAATDVCRMQPTRVLGFAVGDYEANSPLVIDVQRVDDRPASAFTWSEGGTTPADPLQLQVEVGPSADALGIKDGDPVEVIGFFSAADDHAEDFVAASVVARPLARSLVAIHDRANGLVVVPAITADEVRVTLSGTSGANELAILDAGFVGTTPLPAGDTTFVAGNPFDLGFYTLRDRVTGACSVHVTFEGFTLALQTALLDGAVIYNLGATGTYDTVTGELAASLISVVVQ